MASASAGGPFTGSRKQLFTPLVVPADAMTQAASRWPDPTSPWLLIALAVGVVVGSAGWMGALAEPPTAQDLQDTAEQRAKGWDEEARLVGVGASEHASHGPRNFSDPGAQATDEAIGDGEPPAWGYTYRAGNRTLRVTVAANGTILDTTETDASEAAWITGWRVSAREAIETVRDHDDSWEAIDARWAFYALHQHEPGRDPVWILGVGGDQRFRIAAVNATTGAYLGSYTPGGHGWFGLYGAWGAWTAWSWSGSWGGPSDGENASEDDRDETPPTEAGEIEGRLTVTDSEEGHRFAIDHEGHDRLRLQLELEDPEAGAVEVTVEGPEGRSIPLEAGPRDAHDEATLHHPADGPYTVDAELEAGAAQGYTLRWCASSERPTPAADGNEACAPGPSVETRP